MSQVERFPGRNYQLIYADPAWTYRDQARAGKRGASQQYDVMTLEAMCALPIGQLAAPDCLLAMWWVGPMPAEALTLVEAWGFKLYNMTGLVWEKTTVNGHLDWGMGWLTRQNAECCLFATRGKHPQRIAANVHQVIQAPNVKHSQKPPEARQRLTDLLGPVKRLELFARQRARGWHAWGNQLT